MTAHTPASPPLFQRLFYRLPVVGWMAKDVAEGDRANLYFALIAFISLWGISVLTFGLPGLYLPALALVPVMFVILIWISLGKID